MAAPAITVYTAQKSSHSKSRIACAAGVFCCSVIFLAPFSVKVNYKNTSGLKSSRRTPYPSFSISTAISAGILFLPFTQLFTVERFFPSFAARAA
nr:MAG TPA: hypothetical protein [Caudoviricetes sp.]